MDESRLEAMRAVAWNLKLEGQQSRSDCVTELCDEVERLNRMCSHAGILRAQEQHNAMMAEKDTEIERLRAAMLLCVENVEQWMRTDAAASPEDSRSIYEQMCSSLGREPIQWPSDFEA